MNDVNSVDATDVLPEWLGRRAHLTPTALALVADSGTWTFQQLNDIADAAARRLLDFLRQREDAAALASRKAASTRSVWPGPRVALLMTNTPQFVVWVHALAKAGAVLLPLNTRLTASELRWQIDDAGAVAVVHDAAYAPLAREVLRDRPHVGRIDESHAAVAESAGSRTSFAAGAVGVGPAAPSVVEQIRLNDVHSIVYTSGTTGRPKGALLTYGNFWWNATASALNLGVVPGDRWLACMPLFHVGGLSILLRSVLYGMPVVLHESFDAFAVNKAIDERGVTLLSVVAVMLERMVSARGDEPYPSTLRAVLVGGGPVPRPLLERAAQLSMPVLQTYGLTEAASQVATLAPDDALRKLGSAGKPLFATRLCIAAISEEGDASHGGATGVSARSGEVGEITVAGPTVSPGYWNKQEDTAAVLRGEWLHTGDLGYVDDEGYLYVVERREDLIVSGGENVYPAEVEAVLHEHDDIDGAAVVGMRDERWGQVPVAFVVARAGSALTEATVKTHCRERLAAYKVPIRVIFETDLPRNAAGKLLRRQLRERL